MDFGIVVGNVVCTTKEQKIAGTKLLLVQPTDDKGQPSKGATMVAIDSVGAGQGEVILYVKGSSARLTERTENCPVDCTIMAIVDYVEKEGSIIFSKSGKK